MTSRDDKNGGEAILPLPPVGAYLCESVETYAKYWLKAAHEARDAGQNGDAVMFAEQAVNGWKNLAYDLARQAHYYLKTQRHYAEQHTHDLYKTGDKNAPPSILDRNGEVVLGLCKLCGMGEAELVEPCTPSAIGKLIECPSCKTEFSIMPPNNRADGGAQALDEIRSKIAPDDERLGG